MLNSAELTNESVTDTTVDFSWENLDYRVEIDAVDEETQQKTKQWKNLLWNVSGTARAGRVLAIMGPSGAGKSTLMNCINGRVIQNGTHTLDGLVFLNNTVFTQRYKSLLSFVAQDDIVHGKETPREALNFSCRCRLGLSVEEAEVRTNNVLNRLHLEKCADTMLGIPGLVKGVSGGEKKRTNIGAELITNPYILLLDEPTTGLDSVNATRVGSLLQELAKNEGRTVLCTIHSPSSELYAMFDDILLLAKGHTIYHGPNENAPDYFAEIGHAVPPHTNPSEFFMNLLQSDDTELERLWKAWENYAASPKSDDNLSIQPVREDVNESHELLDKHASAKGATLSTQLMLLVQRSLRLYRRDPAHTVGRGVQTVFFALLLGLFYFNLDDTAEGVQDRLGCIFMMAVNAVFLSLMNGVATFPPERAVFLMEQSSESYSPVIYSIAKTVAETPFQIFFPVLYLVILYFMVGFSNSAEAFFIAVLVVVSVANCSYSFGLFCASFFSSPETAMAAVPMAVMPMMIVGGLFANSERLEPYWTWLNHISFVRYTVKALAINEFERIDNLCPSHLNNTCPYQNGQEVLVFLGFEGESWGLSVMAILIMMVVFRVMGAFALKKQSDSVRGKLKFLSKLDTRMLSPKLMSARSPMKGELQEADCEVEMDKMDAAEESPNDREALVDGSKDRE